MSGGPAPDALAVGHALEQVYREERSRLLAAITRGFGGGSGNGGDPTLAEDALQDAALAALLAWPAQGVPRSPAAWLTTTARRKAIDRLRRRAVLADATAMLLALAETNAQAPPDRPRPEASAGETALRLALACCHPALPAKAQVSLALRTVGGLSTGEIAHHFGVTEPAVAKHLVRTRKRVRVLRLRSRDPIGHQVTERFGAVNAVIAALSSAGRHERAAQLGTALRAAVLDAR